MIYNIFMDTKLIAIIIALLGSLSVIYNQTQASDLSEFQAWKLKFGIKYESQFEELYRERVFLENLATIELHNNNELNTYKMGINQFSALTDEEFAEIYLGTVVPTENIIEAEDQDFELTDDIDWVSQGAVTPVKNQGQCGSCWAFSTTGGLEGLSKLAYGTLESFSESQLVDCSGKYGNMACNGGLMDNAFKYVRDHGIVHEDQYPYKPVKQTCKIDSGSFKISGFTDVKSCSVLAKAINQRPVSIAVDASNWSRYSSGVFSNCRTSLNHGVLLIGTKGGDWVVKNSWGSSWGEKGFITLASGNTCGLCNVASYPNK